LPWAVLGFHLKIVKEMAKKVVATLKNKDAKGYAKVIKAVKSDKSGAYSFKEEIVLLDNVKDALKN
jgi:hypothetical protein